MYVWYVAVWTWITEHTRARYRWTLLWFPSAHTISAADSVFVTSLDHVSYWNACVAVLTGVPGAVRRQCIVVVGRPTSRLGRCCSSRIKRTLQIITVVLSFKNPPENDIFTFPALPSFQNVIAFFISKRSGRGGGGFFDVHVAATDCAPQKTQDRRLNK